MKSPYGRRGAICEYYHWTYDYLLHGIGWATLQKMIMDAPNYDYEKEDEKNIVLDDNNADDIINYVNSLNAIIK